MRFFVTYSVMDGALASPSWHAFLILSYWPGKGQKIQVTNAWGFDAAANLDVGYGLRGITFDVSFEQFFQLKANKNLTAPTPSSCRSLALELLRDIGIAEDYLAELTQQNTSHMIPRNSGYLEPIFLHSESSNPSSSTDNNKIIIFRTCEEKKAKLFWTLPPQLLMTNDPKLESIFYLPFTAEEKIKNTIRILQALEKFVENVIVTEVNHKLLQQLTNYIYELYDTFAVIKSRNSKAKVIKKLAEIEGLFADIYSAIIEEWDDEDEPATIVAKLSESEQRAICKLLDRPFKKYSASEA